jgi:hypothetical protein
VQKNFIDIFKARALMESTYEWHKWVKEIPYLNVPDGYLIKAIPPFGGTIIRYIVTDAEKTKSVSVYLDCYDELGIVGQPYWELYPAADGDTHRCLLNETDELLEKIVESIQAG